MLVEMESLSWDNVRVATITMFVTIMTTLCFKTDDDNASYINDCVEFLHRKYMGCRLPLL